MSEDVLRRCRVCGRLHEDFPWGLDGCCASFDICPCCGTTFGYEDGLPRAARAARERWLRDGAAWFRPEVKPVGWSAAAQLASVPESFR